MTDRSVPPLGEAGASELAAAATPRGRRGFYPRVGKRIVDVIGSCGLLVLTLPFLVPALVLSLAVCREGPIFRQERMGRRGRVFTLLKVRTMPTSTHRSPITVKDDARVPGSLRWIRSTKIDELPQLINVIRGDMSLIGPRPTVPEDVRRMTPAQRRRHAVRPGLTGLAQVSGNTALSWPERIELDLAYVDAVSLATDLRIAVMTLRAIVDGSAGESPVSPDEWREGTE